MFHQSSRSGGSVNCATNSSFVAAIESPTLNVFDPDFFTSTERISLLLPVMILNVQSTQLAGFNSNPSAC